MSLHFSDVSFFSSITNIRIISKNDNEVVVIHVVGLFLIPSAMLPNDDNMRIVLEEEANTRVLLESCTPILDDTGESSATGGGARIGLQLFEDSQIQNVVVMTTMKGGTVATAGVHAGNVIVKVDGESMVAKNA